jgi:diguanylate cyclase (GGDEF)-like protein
MPDGIDVSVLVLSGPSAGRYHRFPKNGGTIGRDPEETDICIDDPGISRKHAQIERSRPSHFIIRDLDSRYGIFVDGVKVREHALSDGDRLQISGETVLRIRYEDPKESLTGPSNRRHFLERLDQELGYARRHGTPLTLMMIDLDHFKRINDEHGHTVGDEVLHAVSRLLGGAVRIEDVIARYGGDEFVVLSRGYDLKSGELFAERLRRAVRDKVMRAGAQSFQLSLSIGIACYRRGDVEGAMQLIARADSALYRAKHLGRDRYFVWTNP